MAQTSPFQRVSPAQFERLKAIVGPQHVLTAPDVLEKYSRDETGNLSHLPEVVVRPRTAREISGILTLADQERIAVTPRAGGTGLAGGAVPLFGGIVLSVDRMNEILEIDRENLWAVVEPGVITEVLQNEVQKFGLYYPPDPASRGSCCLGGNVAHNAGGPHAVKYGVTKDFVYGLEAVLPTGEIIQTGGKLLKNVSGYNLTQLLIGSEGTLAVVTKIILKLLPYPKYRRVLLVPFRNVAAAVRTVAKVFQSGVVPAAIEFLERSAMLMAERKKGEKFPYSEFAAVLLVEVDGQDPESVERQSEKVGEVCLEEGAEDAFVADSPEKQKFIWDMRRSVGEAVRTLSVYREADAVVPRTRLPELVAAVQETCRKHGLTATCFGHSGDGNVHVHVLKLEMSNADWEEKVPGAMREMFEKIVALGGTISGEHGIGALQKEYLPLAIGPVELELMRGIKKVFDPGGILNPGKTLPS